MMLWWLKFAATCLLIQSVLATTRRATLGTSMKSFDITSLYSNVVGETADDLLRVYHIEEDQVSSEHVLVAVGNGIVRMKIEYGYVSSNYTIVGNVKEAGYQQGSDTRARFNKLAGFVQLPGEKLLMSDQNNQCIRQMTRYSYSYSHYVTTYAGSCNASRHYSGLDYAPWQTFNRPSTMQYDSATKVIYVLDLSGDRSTYVILSKALYGGFLKRLAIPVSQNSQVNTFIHNTYNSGSFAITYDNQVANASAFSSYQTKTQSPNAFGLTSYDDILVVSDYLTGHITFIDGHRNGYSFSICDTLWGSYYNEPTCTLSKPTALTVANGYLYIGSTKEVAKTGNRTEMKAVISKVSFSTPEVLPETTTYSWNDWRKKTTTYDWLNWRPKTTTYNYFNWKKKTTTDDWLNWRSKTTSYRYNSYDDDSDSYYSSDDYDSGMSGGTVAIIVVACIFGIGLKICLITWRIRRYTTRRVIVRRRCVLVGANTTTTTSRVPYGRLQEPSNPAATGNFPAPPPYSPPTQGTQGQRGPPEQPISIPPLSAPPVSAPPVSAPPAAGATTIPNEAPPSYTPQPSVTTNPPALPPPNTRY